MEKILEQFYVDDFDGETAELHGPQGPFDMMEGRWTLTFDQENFKWTAIQYEDEDDPHGTFELEGTWTPGGKLLVKGIR